MRLDFRGVADEEELGIAFNNAIDAGVMERDSNSHKFWGRFRYLASDTEDGRVVADWFYSALSNVWTRVVREEGAE